MQGMEEVSFKIIASVGEAKSLIMSAIGLAGENNFDGANEQLKQQRKNLWLLIMLTLK